MKEVEPIPLPNMEEDIPKPLNVSRSGRQPSFLDNITRYIQIDDIILIGLVILLLAEGMEDDILIILLIFVLIAGRD